MDFIFLGRLILVVILLAVGGNASLARVLRHAW